jgi:hypothetical protein
MSRPTITERAFELARSGEYSNTRAIQDRLVAEGYHDVRQHFAGKILARQLLKLCQSKRTEGKN